MLNDRPIFIQRSFKKDIPPERLMNTVYGPFGGLLGWLSRSFEVRDTPVDIKRRNTWSGSRHQDGVYTYRITLCLTPVLIDEIAGEFYVEKMKDGTPHSWWGLRREMEDIAFSDMKVGEFYVGLHVRHWGEEQIRQLTRRLLPFILIYGGETTPSSITDELELVGVHSGIEAEKILQELQTDLELKAEHQIGKERK